MLATLRRRNFALVWLGGLISLTGDWLLFIGLPLYVYQLTGSTLATGVAVMSRVLPRLLLGSLAGVFVDRWDRRRVMIVTNLLLGCGLLPLLAVRSASWLWLVYLVSFAQSSLAQFVEPAEGALLPRLVPAEHLVSANALNALNNNLARLVGPPLGGLVVGVWGLAGVTLLDAASFFAAAGLVALVTVDASVTRVTTAVAARSGWRAAFVAVWREWRAGLALVRRARPLAVLFLFVALTGVGEGIVSTLFVPFVTKVLGSNGVGFGLVAASQAVGGLLGSAAIGQVGQRVTPGRLLGLGAVGLGAIDLAAFNAYHVVPGLAPVLVLMTVVGLPAAGLQVGALTLLQTAIADAYRGRIFGAFGTTQALAMLIGAALAGLLGDLVGIVAVLNTQGAVYVAGGVMVLTLLPGGRATASVAAREEEPATLG